MTTPAHDPTDLDVLACEDAIVVLATSPDVAAVGPIGHAWRTRAAHHLTQRLQRQLRRGLPLLVPDTEAQAMSVLRSVAAELIAAADALVEAARALKDDGKGLRANQARLASLRARECAEGIAGHA